MYVPIYPTMKYSFPFNYVPVAIMCGLNIELQNMNVNMYNPIYTTIIMKYSFPFSLPVAIMSGL